MSHGPAAFLACALLIGFGSVAVQVLSPLAAHLAPAARRGRVVGDIAMGIMLGIMAARPAASFLAAETSWRTVFFAAAGRDGADRGGAGGWPAAAAAGVAASAMAR